MTLIIIRFLTLPRTGTRQCETHNIDGIAAEIVKVAVPKPWLNIAELYHLVATMVDT